MDAKIATILIFNGLILFFAISFMIDAYKKDDTVTMLLGLLLLVGFILSIYPFVRYLSSNGAADPSPIVFLVNNLHR